MSRRPAETTLHAHDRMLARARELAKGAFECFLDWVEFPWIFIGGAILIVLLVLPMLMISGVMVGLSVIMYLFRRRSLVPPTGTGATDS